MYSHDETEQPTCICGGIHWQPGCQTAADMDRAVWTARQAAREAARGFRWDNVESPFRRGADDHERSCMVQATASDFHENLR